MRHLFPTKNRAGLRLKQARLCVVALIFALCGVSSAFGQFRASLQGTVSDPEGAIIPGAQVVLTDTDTNKVLTTTTNSSGIYSFNALPPNHFMLVATMAGFKSNTLRNITIIPEQPNNIDVKLSVGDTSITVDVNADTIAPLETSTASLSGTVNSNEIQHLPSAGRDVFKLAQLAPGAFGDGSQAGGGGGNNIPGTQGPGGAAGSSGIFQTENGPQTLSGGGQYETNGISIDGISTVSAVWGGTTVITPNEDSVDNVKITTNGYDAETGRFSGANLQVTTKSGTNQIHGSLFFRINRPGLNAYQAYNGPQSLGPGDGTPASRGLQRDESRFNQFGGSVGGPIWKDKIFAFFAYETIRNSSQDTGNAWYTTTAFNASGPSGSTSSRYLTFPGNTPIQATMIARTCGGPTGVGLAEGVTCNTIAGQGLDIGSPLKSALGTQDLGYTKPTVPGVGGGLDGVADIADYQTSTPRTQTNVQYNGRLDGNATSKDHLAFAIYWVPSSNTSINGPAYQYNLFHHNQTNDAFSVIWNRTFSPTFLNEARANAAGYRWNEIAGNPQSPLGLAQDSVDTTGSINLNSSGALFGSPAGSIVNQWTYGYKDVATKILGNHTVKFGGELTRLEYLQDATYAARPAYTFYNIWDFLNDAPHTEQGQFDRTTGVPSANRFDTRENIWGTFVQDDWKIRPNLTVNLGIRYNYFDSIHAKQNNLPNVRFGTGANEFTGLYIQRGGNLFNPQKGNFGPQLGFAWSPDYFHNKLVVRGGYGLNYNQEEIAISANVSNNPGDTVTPTYTSGSPTSINPDIVYALPSDSSTLFGYPSNPHTITGYNSANLPTTGGLNLTAYPTNLHTAYTHHMSLDLQGDLGHQLVATVGYQGSLAHHLISQKNLYLEGAAQGIAFNPLITSIGYFGDFAASNYSALLVSLKKNMSHHFMVNADFTYSKSMDDGSGPYESDPYAYDNRYAYGRSDFNFGKALKIYGLWQPVLFHSSHGWMEKAVGGWSVSGIYNLHGGFPWNPTSSSGKSVYYDDSGVGTLRPATYNGQAKHDTSNNAFKPTAAVPNSNYTGSSNFAGGGSAYFTAPIYTSTAFPTLPTSFPTPGIAKNSFTGPKYQDLDATLTKDFGLPKLPVLGEDAKFEIRADVFNLFNNTNLDVTQISKDFTASDFGVIGKALGSRTVNFQARFSF